MNRVKCLRQIHYSYAAASHAMLTATASTGAVGAMMEVYEGLVAEIDRIVNSPYPTQLMVYKCIMKRLISSVLTEL